MKEVGYFTYNAIIPFVERPSRYTNSELNLSSGGFEEGLFNLLLVFPDAYEIGMSHQGIQFLYQRAARMEGVGVELGFAPWPDMERLMRASGEPYRSKQTATSARRFDLVGFSMTYELHYTNMLLVLDLAGIPLLAKERGEDDPIVVAGGPAATNPLPFLNAVDAVFIGDGEESLPEAIELLKSLKAEGASRAKCKEALARIEGVYVDGVSSGVTSRLYRLGGGDFAERVIVPSSGIVHDRLSVEVMRGCTRGCRFCHAGMFYRPTRERSVDDIAAAVMNGIDSSGWQEVSLMSLSTSDYGKLDELLERLLPRLEERHISLAMPSLRPETITNRIVEASSLVRKSGFTLAPEAGTERLRKVINKWMTDDVIVEGCERILSAGWKSLKLYFMIGLPTESDEDLDGIVRLVDRILHLPRSSRRFKLSVSISPFVPKPHTPFQWERQPSVEEFLRKEHYLYERLRARRIHLSLRDPRFSVLEGIMARGDRRMWNVLVDAYRAGCRFDGWSGEMRFSVWEEALKKNAMNFDELLAARDPNEALPWDFIRLQVAKPFLVRERSRSLEGVITPDCRTGPCTGCGADCDRKVGELEKGHGEGEEGARKRDAEKEEAPRFSESSAERSTEPSVQPVRYRLIFEKMGSARFLSHMELLDCIRRALRRAALPLNYSKGFNPHPRISAGPSLPVGAEGLREFVDIELEKKVTISLDLFDELLPPGLRIKEIVGPFSRSEGKLSALSRYEYLVSLDEFERIIEGIAESKIGASKEATRWFGLFKALTEVDSAGEGEREAAMASHTQSPNHTEESTEQSPGHADESTEQSPNHTDESTEQSPNHADESTEQSPNHTDESPEQSPGHTDEISTNDRTKSFLHAYLAVVGSEKRAFFEEFFTSLGDGIGEMPAAVLGSAIKASIGEKITFTGARGKERRLDGVRVKRISSDNTIEIAIDASPSSPTIRELLSLVIDKRLVPIVRVTRLSIRYESPEGFVDPAGLPALRQAAPK